MALHPNLTHNPNPNRNRNRNPDSNPNPYPNSIGAAVTSSRTNAHVKNDKRKRVKSDEEDGLIKIPNDNACMASLAFTRGYTAYTRK